jgi:photosynthetic reaction center cytochrome c subunit
MKIRATLLALSFGILSCVPAAFGQDAPKKKQMDPNKPAGEAFKNVQLLKDLPTGQFLQAMRSFNAALGVECGFCHVDGDRAADTKHEKLMARKMITMTHEINEKNFNGKMEVKCYTCHKGAEHPVSEAPAK